MLVRNVPAAPANPLSRRAAMARAIGLLREPAFRRLTLAAGGLALATLSDGFLYLGLQDRMGFAPRYLPLLCVYSSLLVSSISPFALVLYLAAFGTFYAATDGVVMALAGALLPEEMRASGMGLLTAVVASARL